MQFFTVMRQLLTSGSAFLGARARQFGQRINGAIGRRPFAAFLIGLAVLLGLIVLSNRLARPAAEPTSKPEAAKQVDTFTIGAQPTVRVQAQVKKTGVVTIVAQTGGVVQKVYKKEGHRVQRGTTLAWISTNYVGGTISSAQRQQAQKSFTFNEENLERNKAVVAEQRRLAQLSRDNTEQLRQVSEKSVQETKDLISLNSRIMDRVNESIKPLEEITTPTDTQKTTLTSLLSQKAQLQSGLNQLNAALRATEYQVNPSNPPTQLADAQRELALKQLELQEKSLELQRDLSKLALRVSQINESLNYPASPFAGTVERVNVVPGQVVAPGEVLAIITADDVKATAEVNVNRRIARLVSLSQPSRLWLDNEEQAFEETPLYVSSQPTTGSLYSIKYQLPEPLALAAPNNGYITIDLPLGMSFAGNTSIYIPLDAIYQSETGAYVYLAVDNRAVVRSIELGEVIGSYVAVTSGLAHGDTIILDRTVLDGTLIEAAPAELAAR